MVNERRVLVVDGLSETGEVLKAVLEPRGHRVNRIRQATTSSDVMDEPNVVVLHDDNEEHWADVPRVVIGSARVPSRRNTQYLQNPFEYAELVAAVERFLSEPESAAA